MHDQPLRKNLWLALTLLAAVFLTYSNVYENQFVYDDGLLITANRFIQSWRHFPAFFMSTSTAGAGFGDSFFRPMQTFCYLLVQTLFGPGPSGFHFLNILIHALNTLLVLALAMRLGLRQGVAFFAALLWALHPMHIEPVTYMSGTADSLHSLFVLLGLVVVLPDFSWRRIAMAFFMLLLALLSKEGSVVFPALVALLIFLISKDRFHLKPYLKTLPLWLAVAGYMLLRTKLIGPTQNFSVFENAELYASNFLYRLETFFALLTAYFKLMVWPVPLGIEQNFPVYTSLWALPVLFGALITVLFVTAAARTLLQRSPDTPWKLWAVSSFFVAYLPMSGLLAPINNLYLEHWMYLPSIPLFIAGTFVLSQRIAFKTLSVVLIAAALVLAARTHMQNRVWSNAVTLYTSILSYNPSSDRIRQNLAIEYHLAGDLERAIAEFKTVLSRTSIYPQAFSNLGLVYLQKGDTESAKKYLLESIERHPSFAPAYEAMAFLHRTLGEEAEAHRYQKKYLELMPIAAEDKIPHQ